MYSSTCFGRPHAHHQELNNCRSSLWLYRWGVVVVALLVVLGPVGPTTTNSTGITTLQLYNQRLLLRLLSSWWWVRTPETCWAVHTSKRHVINSRNCCIRLDDLFELFKLSREQRAWLNSCSDLRMHKGAEENNAKNSPRSPGREWKHGPLEYEVWVDYSLIGCDKVALSNIVSS